MSPSFTYILVFWTVFTNVGCRAQADTVIGKVQYQYISRHSNGQIHELGNFLTNNSHVKHGAWVVYDTSGVILEKGRFKRNTKTGFWLEDTNRGDYKRGKKHGEWYNGCNRFTIYKRGKEKRTRIASWS
ncbi:MAG: hypothetical protein V4580_06565 [Bacteroidota bacterium]